MSILQQQRNIYHSISRISWTKTIESRISQSWRWLTKVSRGLPGLASMPMNSNARWVPYLNRGIQGNCKSGNYFVFWARDFLTMWRNPKQEFFYLGPSHIPTGELQNGKCQLRGHILAFALCTISVPDWDRRHDIHICHWFIWGDDLFEILSFFMFPTFTRAIANMQCPFNKNIAFIDKGI